MRINQLDLIRFGKFTDRQVTLPSAERDFHVIAGPNEAGKSTIRAAIQDLLYGIPKNTPHSFLHPMPDMRLGALIEHGGTTLAFHRTKGNKQTLRTPKDGILADAMEAVLGAVFLDGGFGKARDVVRRIWIGEGGGAKPEAASGHIDPKSALQEWAQGRGLALPRYISLARTGPDHAPMFTCEVVVPGHDPASGTGPSKRAAEQAAASALLEAVALMAKPASAVANQDRRHA